MRHNRILGLASIALLLVGTACSSPAPQPISIDAKGGWSGVIAGESKLPIDGLLVITTIDGFNNRYGQVEDIRVLQRASAGGNRTTRLIYNLPGNNQVYVFRPLPGDNGEQPVVFAYETNDGVTPKDFEKIRRAGFAGATVEVEADIRKNNGMFPGNFDAFRVEDTLGDEIILTLSSGNASGTNIEIRTQHNVLAQRLQYTFNGQMTLTSVAQKSQPQLTETPASRTTIDLTPISAVSTPVSTSISASSGDSKPSASSTLIPPQRTPTPVLIQDNGELTDSSGVPIEYYLMFGGMLGGLLLLGGAAVYFASKYGRVAGVAGDAVAEAERLRAVADAQSGLIERQRKELNGVHGEYETVVARSTSSTGQATAEIISNVTDGITKVRISNIDARDKLAQSDEAANNVQAQTQAQVVNIELAQRTLKAKTADLAARSTAHESDPAHRPDLEGENEMREALARDAVKKGKIVDFQEWFNRRRKHP